MAKKILARWHEIDEQIERSPKVSLALVPRLHYVNVRDYDIFRNVPVEYQEENGTARLQPVWRGDPDQLSASVQEVDVLRKTPSGDVLGLDVPHERLDHVPVGRPYLRIVGKALLSVPQVVGVVVDFVRGHTVRVSLYTEVLMLSLDRVIRFDALIGDC